MPSRFEKYTTHHTSRRTDGWEYTQPAAYFVTMCTAGRACLFGTVRQGRMYVTPLGRTVATEWKKSEAIRDRVHLDAFVVMPNHLHGIVVFADPSVAAPTCPRGYRAFRAWTDDSGGASEVESTATGGAGNPSRESDSTKSSTGVGARSTDSSNPEKASAGRSTLGGKSDSGDAVGDDRPTGPAPKSLGAFVAGFKSAATTCINAHRGTPGAPVWQRNYHDRILRTERHWRAARRYIHRNPAEWGAA